MRQRRSRVMVARGVAPRRRVGSGVVLHRVLAWYGCPSPQVSQKRPQGACQRWPGIQRIDSAVDTRANRVLRGPAGVPESAVARRLRQTGGEMGRVFPMVRRALTTEQPIRHGVATGCRHPPGPVVGIVLRGCTGAGIARITRARRRSGTRFLREGGREGAGCRGRRDGTARPRRFGIAYRHFTKPPFAPAKQKRSRPPGRTAL
jgi:hypothetical protein